MAAKIPKTFGQRGRSRLVSEINVTPMVDVMLVLLIIFMVASPMLVAGVEVDLPKTNSNPISGNDKPIVITIKKDGEIYLADTKIDISEIAVKLENIVVETQDKKNTRIAVKGDNNVPYGKMIEMIDEIKNAGFTKIALISDIKHK